MLINPLKIETLRRDKKNPLQIKPDQEALCCFQKKFSLPHITKLLFSGYITAYGKTDWLLTGSLKSSVRQQCVVTLQPLKTRIDESIRRVFVKELIDENIDYRNEDVIEIPADIEREPLPAKIDIEAILAETMLLALPAFPRKPGAEINQDQIAASFLPKTEKENPFFVLSNFFDTKKASK